MEIEDLAKKDYYVILGAGGDIRDWTNGYQEMFDKEGIGRIKEWGTFSGREFNKAFGITDGLGDSLTLLVISLEGLDVGRLALFRLRMQDRWSTDLIECLGGSTEVEQ